MSTRNDIPAQRKPAQTWAEGGGRLHTLDTPDGAVNLNVDGRQVVGPLQGFGHMWQKTYKVRLEGIDATPSEVIAAWKSEFPRFNPPENRFYPSLAGITPGEVVLINAQTPGGPVSTGVMVLYADDESFTLMTPQGHPESGWITFSAYLDGGCVVAQVQSMARANDPIYEVAFRIIGSRMQESIWQHVLTSLAQHYGVTAEVSTHKTCVDPRLQWSQMGNVWQNAQIRTMMYTMAAPLRWVKAWAKRDGG